MNITFVFSILGVVFMVLRRLPEAASHEHISREKMSVTNEHSALSSKGLPVMAYSKTKNILLQVWHKIAQFLLEAKGLKHSPKLNYNFQKMFKRTGSDDGMVMVKNEKYFIDLIKRNPKDYTYYDMLGQFYIEEKKMTDAVNLYEYLVNHAPTEIIYWVRLGLASLYLRDWEKAEKAYERALSLDQSHPSRFYNLALAFQGQSKFKQAVMALDKALELEPKNQKYFDLRFELESKSKSKIPLENIHKKR